MRVLAIQMHVSNARFTVVLTLVGFVLQCMTVSADTWDIETVDYDGDVGQYTSLALDALGFPHISYYDETNKNLKYAYRDANGWHIQTIDFIGTVGSYTSLALDTEGFPHIGYHGNGELKYAFQDFSGWHVQIIDPGGNYQNGWGSSLVLDSSGFPHIRHGNFWYSHQDSSGWTHEAVPPGWGWPELGTSLALDALGGPHITYPSYGVSDYAMRYCFKPEGYWQSELPDLAPTSGAGSSLLINASGFPCVSYLAVGLSIWYAKYAYKTESGWLVQTVDEVLPIYTPPPFPYCTSLVLDSGGSPHFCYMDAGNLVIQHWDGSGWYLETVDSEGNVGGFPSMALDASDRPHISYSDETQRDLKYARLLPDEIALLGELQAGQLCLTWSPVEGVEEYWVFGIAREPWFLPDLSPPTYVNRLAVVPSGTTTWSSPNGVGDPINNWTYLVIAMENTSTELARSNRVGEYDFDTDIP